VSMRVIIVGAGGHGRVVADIVCAMAEHVPGLSVAGFVDDDPMAWGATRLGLPVLGPVDQLTHLPHDAAIVAIGDNPTRADVCSKLLAAGETLFTAVHPRATVGRDVHIGAGVMVCAGAVINVSAEVETAAIVNTGAMVEHDCRLGAYTHVAPGTRLGGGVAVGEGTLLGIGSIVLPGRRIADWAIVGAGAVVVHDVTAHSTVVGVPARCLVHRRSI